MSEKKYLLSIIFKGKHEWEKVNLSIIGNG
jgi:hypothetical protein